MLHLILISSVFLSIYPDPIGVGMGNSGVSNPGIWSLYYNPAGISFINKPEFMTVNFPTPPGLSYLTGKYLIETFSGNKEDIYPNWLPGIWGDMYLRWSGCVYPVNKYLSIGFSYTYLTTGTTEVYISPSNIYKFVTYDECSSLSISYKSPLNYKLFISTGISLKRVFSFLIPDWLVGRIFPESGGGGSAETYTMDSGIMINFMQNAFVAGISFNNIFGELKYFKNGDPEPLVKIVRYGFTFNPIRFFELYAEKEVKDYLKNYSIKISFENTKFSESEYSFFKNAETWTSWGIELGVFDFFYIRYGHFEDKEGGRVGDTKGVGFNFKVFQIDVADDADIYAFFTHNYRLSWILKPYENLKFKNRKIEMLVTSASISLFPGAPQFLRNDKLKGFLFSTASFFFFYGWKNSLPGSSKKKNYGTLLITSYALSLFENIYHYLK